MKPKSTIALTAIALLLTTFAAAAQSGSLPNLDTQKLCRNRAKAAEGTDDKTITSQTFDTCMRAERDARAALAAAWKDIPPNYKAQCIKPNVFSASYEEWISCLELNIDVKKLRSPR
jgi:hypothetical protein